MFLTRHARHITILVRGSDFSCAQAVPEPAKSNKKITALCNTEFEEAGGDNVLRYLRYRNTATGEVTEYLRARWQTIFG